jgi:hypothetical protein
MLSSWWATVRAVVTPNSEVLRYRTSGRTIRSTFATRSVQPMFVYPGVGSPTPADRLSPTTPNRRHGASNSKAAAVNSGRQNGSVCSIMTDASGA